MSYEPITDEENEKFQAFANAIEQNGAGVAGSLALMRAQLDDEDVALIVYVHESDDEEWDAHPIAILVTNDIFERLTPAPDMAEAVISGERS